MALFTDPLALEVPKVRVPQILGGRRPRRRRGAPAFEQLSPEEERRITRELARMGVGGLHAVGRTLDFFGGQVRRGVSSILEGMGAEKAATDAGQPPSGRDLLTQLGAPPNELTGLASFGSLRDLAWDTAGVAVEIVLDPLTHLGLGLGFLGKGAGVARKVGALGEVPEIAARKLGRTTGEIASRVEARAGQLAAERSLGQEAAERLARRELGALGMPVGKREAMMNVTLREVVGESSERMAAVTRAAGGPERLQPLLDEPLGGLVGVGPFGSPVLPTQWFSGKFAQTIARKSGQAWRGVKESGFGRAVQQGFFAPVMGTVGKVMQAVAPRLARARAEGRQLGRRSISTVMDVYDLEKGLQAEDQAMAALLNPYIGDLMGGATEAATQPVDLGALIQTTGALAAENPAAARLLRNLNNVQAITGPAATKADLAEMLQRSAVSEERFGDMLDYMVEMRTLSPETFDPFSQEFVEFLQEIGPKQAEAFLDYGEKVRNQLGVALDRADEIGVRLPEYFHPDIGYHPRYAADWDGRVSSADDLFDPKWVSMNSRSDLFYEVPKLRANRMGMDGRITGPEAMADMDEAAEIIGLEYGLAKNEMERDLLGKVSAARQEFRVAAETARAEAAVETAMAKQLGRELGMPKGVLEGITPEALRTAVPEYDQYLEVIARYKPLAKFYRGRKGLGPIFRDSRMDYLVYMQQAHERLAAAEMEQVFLVNHAIKRDEAPGTTIETVPLTDVMKAHKFIDPHSPATGPRARLHPSAVDRVAEGLRDRGLEVGTPEPYVEALMARYRQAEGAVKQARKAKPRRTYAPLTPTTELLDADEVARRARVAGQIAQEDKLLQSWEKAVSGEEAGMAALREEMRIWRPEMRLPSEYELSKVFPEMQTADLSTFGLLKEHADELMRIRRAYTDPRSLNKVGNFIEDFLSLWRASQTLPWFAFGSRNLTGGQVQNAMLGGFSIGDVWSVYRLARDGKPLRGLKKVGELADEMTRRGMQVTDENATRILQEIIYEHELVGTRFAGHPIREVAEDWKAGIPGLQPAGFGEAIRPLAGKEGATWAKPFSLAGVGEQTATQSPVFLAGQKFNWTIETLNRVAPVVTLMKKGWSSRAAIARVKAAQVDYANRAFTPFERTLSRFVIPFYRFQKKMAGFVAQEMAERPGGPLAQFIRITSSGGRPEEIMPSYVAETMAIPLPFTEPRGGGQRVMSSFGFMHEDPLRFLGGGLTGAALELGSRAGPWGAVGEWLTGMSFWQRGAEGGRPLRELDPTMGRLATQLVPGLGMPAEEAVGLDPLWSRDQKLANLAETAVRVSPFSRLATSLRTLTDPRKRLTSKAPIPGPAALVNLALGMRLSDVTEQARARAMQEMINERLAQVPGARELRIKYIREEVRKKLPPEEQRTLKEIQALQRQMSRRRGK